MNILLIEASKCYAYPTPFTIEEEIRIGGESWHFFVLFIIIYFISLVCFFIYRCIKFRSSNKDNISISSILYISSNNAGELAGKILGYFFVSFIIFNLGLIFLFVFLYFVYIIFLLIYSILL